MRAKTTKLIVCLLGAALCRGQRIITTFAGTDLTYPSTSLPANGVAFGPVFSTAVSPAGEIYFVGQTRHLILKFDPTTNSVTVVAGIGIGGYSGDGGPATKAELDNPAGMAFNAAGNLFIADNENGVVRKIDTAGTITTFASVPYVVGLTFGPDGALYASNYFQIQRISADGSLTIIAGGGEAGYAGDGGPATKALLYGASGIIFDKAGNLLIADRDNNAIRKIDTKGIISTIAGDGQNGPSVAGPAGSTHVSAPSGLALDPTGNLYVGGFSSGQLLKIDVNDNLTILNSDPSTFFFTTPGPLAKAALATPNWPAFRRSRQSLCCRSRRTMPMADIRWRNHPGSGSLCSELPFRR